MAVGRRHYSNERLIKFMLLNNDFDILKDDEQLLECGEDPRCFYHNNEIYIQDNYWDDMHLINCSKSEKVKIDIPGKNISFISHQGKLYFIHYMCPFTLYEFCYDTGEIFPIDVYQHNFSDYEYRGGTPGYKLCDNIYYGFGHRTYTADDYLKHDIFYWEVDFSKDKPYIYIANIDQPPGSLNICDPTSVIEINDKSYLVTAESHYPWFEDQEYFTNIYEINFHEKYHENNKK